MPLDLPPQPPAIHAPVPGQQVQNSTSMQAHSHRTVQTLVNATRGSYDPKHPWFHFRWWHVKRWHGKRSASLKSRGNKRKAARKKKR